MASDAPAYERITVRPLSPTVGGEISAVDGAPVDLNDIDGSTFAEMSVM